ncbi:hypothetical protein MLD38_015338 [Melastoma candidum]|uniref:Uncharacterized protein n=1 Tax=Melastoma candidum TaxID=119954 RepID=A0ACB9RFL2_9MYRT|nr:hypothetical protein MLD38_015338 [Melastoma candidum]
MGKYLKKSKPTTDVASSSPLLPVGVCTRAKTLALQRLHQVTLPDPDLCYLHLRNRRLHKTTAPILKGRQVKSNAPVSTSDEVDNGGFRGSNLNLGVEGSFGENDLEFDARDSDLNEEYVREHPASLHIKHRTSPLSRANLLLQVHKLKDSVKKGPPKVKLRASLENREHDCRRKAADPPSGQGGFYFSGI